ncbi:hypothetical protein DCAR_0520804 [Daucus carota subsp. sativus]|uniref:Uncharacterized protein n=1 Tax=Daucus carota subsp. sativus TaxID=79200 RepID=A0A164YSZ8_DAUCS|nr:hypothetical protein DCAR_0520804 [Daucus carota subsp. sativus]
MAGWSKPTSANVCKVNCKGIFDRGMMKASVASVMRNHRGEWVRGNAGMMGLLVPLAAELWSIFYGLKMAWEMGNVHSVIIESDCKRAVDEVNNIDSAFVLADLVEMINSIMTLATSELTAADGGLRDIHDAPASLSSMLAAEMA